MKKIIALILTALLMLSFASCSMTGREPNLQFKQSGENQALYRYKGTSTEEVFTVPDSYEAQTVTKLLDFSVANAEYLKTLNIGSNIEEIDVWALTNCPILQSINVSPDNPNFKSADGVLYNKDMTELIAYPNGKTPLVKDDKGVVTNGGNFVVPDTVVKIRENAFYLCNNLFSIKFNNGLVEVGNKAFLKCENLSEINLPNTVTTIGIDAFSYCNSVKTLEIPSSVQSIGDYGFFSTSSQLEKIIVHQKDETALTLGKNWIPNSKNSINSKVSVEYVGS